MNNEISLPLQGLDSAEIQEWLESLDSVLRFERAGSGG